MNKLRKFQVYTWQEMTDWAKVHKLLFSPIPDRWSGRQGLELHIVEGARAAFLCDGTNDGGETMWTCTYVHYEYALPPMHYYSILFWNEENRHAAVFITCADSHLSATTKAEEEVGRWKDYVVWSVNLLRSIETGEVIFLGCG